MNSAMRCARISRWRRPIASRAANHRPTPRRTRGASSATRDSFKRSPATSGAVWVSGSSISCRTCDSPCGCCAARRASRSSPCSPWRSPLGPRRPCSASSRPRCCGRSPTRSPGSSSASRMISPASARATSACRRRSGGTSSAPAFSNTCRRPGTTTTTSRDWIARRESACSSSRRIISPCSASSRRSGRRSIRRIARRDSMSK